MPQNFVACDRDRELLLRPSLREWLPEDHVGWLVLPDLFGDLGIPLGGLDRAVWLDKFARKLSREPQTARVRIAREQLRDIKA